MNRSKRTALKATGLTSLKRGTWGFFAAAMVTIFAMTAKADMPPTANLMAYYPLDGVINVNQVPNLVPGWGNAILPTSGGSISGYISVQPGVVGNGLRLDNTSSYIHSGTMDPFTYAGTDAFTTMFWVWTPNSFPNGSFGFLVNKQQQGVATYFRTLIRNTDDIQIGVTPDRQTSMISPDPSGRWMHVAIAGTKSGTTATWQVYVDGVQVLSPSANTTTLAAGAAGYGLRFGAAANGGTQAATNMRIDEYYFYNTVLTEAQINGYLNSLIIPTGLIWYGGTSANWDTSTANWNGGASRYQETGGAGDAVTFDDNVYNDGINPPNTNINLTTTLRPATVNVANSGYPYRFSGAGKLSGGTILYKDNSGLLHITTANDFSGGTTLKAGDLLIGNNLALGTGPVTLAGGVLSSDSATPRTLTNAVGLLNDVNTTATFGTDAAAGSLTLSGPVNFRAGGRALRFNNATAFSGGSSNGYMSAKSGPGTLTLNGLHNWSGGCTIREGLVSLSGATLTNAGALALNCSVALGLAKVTVGSGSSLTLTGTGSYLRLGVNGDTTATNQCDITGQVRLIGDGRFLMSAGGTIAIANLLSGSDVTLGSIQKETTSGSAQVSFNGSTLRAQGTTSTFMQGLDVASILSGGLTVDSAGYDVTIAQPLLNGGGGGGLTKTGSGTLTLTATNTYTGTTLVNTGECRLGTAYSGASAVTVANGAVLGLWSEAAGSSAKLSSATLGTATGAGLHAWFTGQSGNPTTPAGYITNLTLNGIVPVQVDTANPLSVSATAIPLVRYVNLSGSGTVTASLSGGIGGYVTNNSATKTIELLVTNVAPLVWTGSGTNSWDVGVSLNWKKNSTPVSYANGSIVLFDDSALRSDVLMVGQLSPNGITISNSALVYSFTNSGAGKISGDAPVAIAKDGTNVVSLAGTNDFTGDVIVKRGMLALNNASALGSYTIGNTYVSNGASLNLRNVALGANRELIYVSGQGYAGLGALYTDGSNFSDIDSFRDVRLMGDTTVGAPANSRFGFTDSTATLTCAGGLYKLTKVGGGWFQFEDAMITVGEIEVKEGVLQTAGNTRIATNSSPLILNNGTLRMLSVNAPIDRPLFFTNGVVHVVGTANAATQNKLAGVVTLGTTGTFLLEANTVGTVTGEITGPGDLIKTGSGYLALLGANTYTGNTVVSNGVLEIYEHTSGSPVGSIANSARIHLESPGALDVYWASPWTLQANQILSGRGGINGTVVANGTVAPGTSGSLGWLNVSYDLTLAGTNIMKITRSGGLANDSLTVGGYLAYGGVLKVVLTGTTPLQVNDTFTLFYFPNAAPTGGFSEIQLPSGYTWNTDQLLVDGTMRVTGVLGPPTLGMTQIGNDLQFTWTGSYKLQAQTNSPGVGLTTNWFDYPNGTNGVTVPIDTTKGSVFFRLSTL